MRRMLKDFGHEMKTPTKLFMDNKSAIWLSEKMGAFAKDKPMDIGCECCEDWTSANEGAEGFRVNFIRGIMPKGVC
jgi:hypothetical protein